MTPLERLFEQQLPALVKKSPRKPRPAKLVGFAATGGGETGYWVLSLAEGAGRRGRPEDRPDVVIEAQASVLVLLFGDALDVAKAIEAGVLAVRGEREVLTELAALVRVGR